MREKLAALAHEQWSGWMQYLWSKAVHDATGGKSDGAVTIEPGYAKALRRQMDTPYEDLPYEEQESDRHEADRVLALLAEAEDENNGGLLSIRLEEKYADEIYAILYNHAPQAAPYTLTLDNRFQIARSKALIKSMIPVGRVQRALEKLASGLTPLPSVYCIEVMTHGPSKIHGNNTLVVFKSQQRGGKEILVCAGCLAKLLNDELGDD